MEPFEAGQVAFGTGRGEGTGDGEEDHALACENLGGGDVAPFKGVVTGQCGIAHTRAKQGFGNTGWGHGVFLLLLMGSW